MNRYGHIAMTHWKRWLPNRYSQIENPQQFFQDLGQQIEDQVLDLTPQIERRQQPSPDYLTRVGQLNMARKMAEERVLADLAYLKPEDQAEEDSSEEPNTNGAADLMDAQGMPKDRSHPLWEAQDDPEVSVEDFRSLLARWHQSLESSR